MGDDWKKHTHADIKTGNTAITCGFHDRLYGATSTVYWRLLHSDAHIPMHGYIQNWLTAKSHGGKSTSIAAGTSRYGGVWIVFRDGTVKVVNERVQGHTHYVINEVGGSNFEFIAAGDQ